MLKTPELGKKKSINPNPKNSIYGKREQPTITKGPELGKKTSINPNPKNLTSGKKGATYIEKTADNERKFYIT